MFNLDDCVACITSKVAKTLGYRIERKIEHLGVTRVQWMALYHIEEANKLTQKELSVCMALKEATIARLIDRMEKEGLVKRVHTSKDKRMNYIEVTSKGHMLNEKATILVDEFKDMAIKGISTKDLDIYKKVLDQMLENTKDIKGKR